MSPELVKRLRAPNGLEYHQPLGLLINNQWVEGHAAEKIVTISPA